MTEAENHAMATLEVLLDSLLEDLDDMELTLKVAMAIKYAQEAVMATTAEKLETISYYANNGEVIDLPETGD